MLPLSIIIPSYNRASLMDKTLQSLTRQSRKDFQTILVDHGSTDNTEEIYWKYKDMLRISYFKIARDDYSPGSPRDFGVRKSETPLIAFIDSGTVVPSRYVEAHIAFHHLHSNHVGIGLQYRKDDAGEDFVSLFSQGDIDLAYPVLKEAQFQDVREGIDLENSSIPWLFGWTSNISLPGEAYFSAGGFDLELKGWGFEDADLCYRLSKQGLRFSFVEDGWNIEIPQPRQPMQERMESGQRNILHCYFKQRSLVLESLILAGMLLRKAIGSYRALPATSPEAFSTLIEKMRSESHQQTEEIFRYLTTIGQDNVAFPHSIANRGCSRFTRPTLFIGGTVQEAQWYDYITLADEGRASTPSIWSCCGIRIPLADHSLETVIVSDIWKKLNWSVQYSFGISSMSLLEVLISEIQRTAKQAIFIHSPSASSNRASLSVEALENMCHKSNLSFQIIQ